MTEPTPPRPVPGPPRPGPGPTGEPAPVPGPAGVRAPVAGAAPETPRPVAATPFSGLEERPVAEHVVVFEEEHARLQRELGTIDRL